MTEAIQTKQSDSLTFKSFLRILKSAIAAEAIFPVEAKGSWSRATHSQESIVEFKISRYVVGFVNDGGDLSCIKYIKLNGLVIATFGQWLYTACSAVVQDCPTDALIDSEFRHLELILRNS